MGITALYAQGENSIKVRFQFTDHSDPTDSSRIAEKICIKLFNAVNWAVDKKMDTIRTNKGKYYSWTYVWKEKDDKDNEQDYMGTITQSFGGNKTYFYINLPEEYDSEDRDVIQTIMQRNLRK